MVATVSRLIVTLTLMGYAAYTGVALEQTSVPALIVGAVTGYWLKGGEQAAEKRLNGRYRKTAKTIGRALSDALETKRG